VPFKLTVVSELQILTNTVVDSFTTIPFEDMNRKMYFDSSSDFSLTSS
jgi:hypothetical protein